MSNARPVKLVFWLMWPFYIAAVAVFLPANIWMDVKHYSVVGGTPENVEVVFQRDIDFNFPGGFTAAVRDIHGEIICPVGEGNLPYSEDSSLPRKITLGWWLGHDQCSNLQPGIYTLSTQWKINTPWGIPKFVGPLIASFEVLDDHAPQLLIQQQEQIKGLIEQIEVLKLKVEVEK